MPLPGRILSGSEFHMRRELSSNLSGNEVCQTNSLILLVKNMLCSKLHSLKGFDTIMFSYKIERHAREVEWSEPLREINWSEPLRGINSRTLERCGDGVHGCMSCRRRNRQVPPQMRTLAARMSTLLCVWTSDCLVRGHMTSVLVDI
jgi:hypothetical protein